MTNPADTRLAQLTVWLDTVFSEQDYSITPLGGDASFRRYLRLTVQGHPYMVMDAPPEKERVDEFIDVAEFLASQSVRVPKIVAKDTSQGFLVLEDFGDELLSMHLEAHTVAELYGMAMKQIVQMQLIPPELISLPEYSEALLNREMELFAEWFLPNLGVELTEEKQQLWETTKATVKAAVLAQPQGFVHRDYHSRNLMVLDSETEFGVIDFQDAVVGAHTYDLVSIIRDAYVAWPEEQVTGWIHDFLSMQQAAGLNTDMTPEQMEHDVNIMGVQRQLKVLGIFVRLSERDGKTGYLGNLPQVFDYLLYECAILPELADFNDWLKGEILPAFIAQNETERGYLSKYL